MNSISQSLDFRQSQNLVMTPQLQQAIKLLQLNNHELNEFVEGELADNPLLEKQESESNDSTQTESLEAAGSDSMDDNFANNFDQDVKPESEAQDFDAGSNMANIGAGGTQSFNTLDSAFENSMSKPETLREHLLDQLFLSFDDPRDRMIGVLLIERLDESGYLREEIATLSEILGASEERIHKLLEKMKHFGPTGVFAANLEECLAMQLDDAGLLDEPMQILLEHLNMLADHDFDKLADKCNVNTTYLQDMIGDVRALNPKPASNFDHIVVQTAVPDVLMKKLPKHVGGGWKVELNTDTLPRVLVNQEYYTQVSGSTTDKKDREYITSKLHSANWLVKALDQRAQTILKVASEIIEQQDAFFNYGIEFLKPLTLKDIAEEIDMHESTVSRVTNNKYIGTPRGIFELKYFFSTALISEDGTAHSAQSIKARIKTLTDEEEPKTILSDDKIVEILQAEGIDIARRTVAKYREALHIPSSIQRRKQKKHLIEK